jgi:hypothetical protein
MIVAEEAGFPTAQFMLGRHLSEGGASKRITVLHTTGCAWLLNSSRVLEECHRAMDQLKSGLNSAQLQYLEQQTPGKLKRG